MKTMTCKQLGGACDMTFSADTFKHIVVMGKDHRLKMFNEKEPAHLESDAKMQILLKDPKIMLEWVEKLHKEFDDLPED